MLNYTTIRCIKSNIMKNELLKDWLMRSVVDWGFCDTRRLKQYPSVPELCHFRLILFGGNLRQPSLPKTSRIIALPVSECNRKSKNGASRLDNCSLHGYDNEFRELALYLRIQPTVRQYLVPHPSQFKAWKCLTCPTSRTRHISKWQSAKS